MNKRDQKKFVHGLSKKIADDICQQILDGKIPNNWDGHELRRLLYYRHLQSMSISDCMSKNTKRRREFENTRIVNNL